MTGDIYYFFFFGNGLIDGVIVIGWTDSDFKISRALVHGLGIHLSNLGPTNRVDQTKKEEEENGCVQAVHSFITLSKATFDLLDTSTAPGCFAVSVYSHVSHKRINYQTTKMYRY